MPDESSAPAKSKDPSLKEQTPQATLAAAIIGLGAMLPNKTVGTALSITAPFISIGLIWIVRVVANEWLEGRKATAHIRRLKGYIHDIDKELKGTSRTSPRYAQLEAHRAQLRERLHEHQMQDVRTLLAPTAPPAPVVPSQLAALPPALGGAAPVPATP